ncbi:hypothetical protein G6F32_015185 [Rhizopus arrhizus]|nr:hypothetical protein G6F32_015185 [Rhizopus arrhizus]
MTVILVLDLGVVVAAAQGHQHVVGQVRLEVQLEALADGLVGVEQGGGVVAATHGDQLLSIDVVAEHVEAQACATVEQVGLDAGFIRDHLHRIGRGAAAEGQTALDRRCTEALGHARIGVDVVSTDR